MRADAAKSFVLGVDIGGTSIKVGLLDQDLKVVHLTSCPTPAGKHGAPTVAAIAGMLDRVLAGCSICRSRIVAVGIATAGSVQCPEGNVQSAPNLGWTNVPLRAMAAEALELPVVVDSDILAAACAEWKTGVARGLGTVIYLSLGTGIGAGLVVGGHPHRGASGAAGNIGHNTVSGQHDPCRCGKRGCLETVAGGPAIVRRANIGRPGTPLQDVGEVTEAASRGDPLARAVLHSAGQSLGVALAQLANALDPDMIVLGGGMARAGEVLLSPLESAFHAERLCIGVDKLKVTRGQHGTAAGVMGAGMLAIEGIGQAVPAARLHAAGHLPG